MKGTVSAELRRWLVPFTPGTFAKAIIDLLDNHEKATEIGRRGQEWVTKNRNFEILARRVSDRYFKLMQHYV